MPDLPDAIILCGGAGTRLRSITGESPKAMAAVNGRPFLELVLRQLHRHRFPRVILATGSGSEAIRRHFGDRAFGLELVYSSESAPLGTGGALRHAWPLLRSDTALVLNGDSYTDVDLALFVTEHNRAKADISIVVVAADGRDDCGSVVLGKNNQLQRFQEKNGGNGSRYINAGIYLISSGCLATIPSGSNISLEHEILPQWIRHGNHVRAHVASASCIDIGTPDRFLQAQKILARAEAPEMSRQQPFAGSMDPVITGLVRSNIERSRDVHDRLISACLPAITEAAHALISAYLAGHKAIFLGNGGSAADAQHLAAEFVGRYLQERDPLPALALNANSSAVTAIGNDYGYDMVFARQLQALAAPGDVVVAISTSGNSASVVEAVLSARRLRLFTIGLTGASGGRLRGLVDTLIAVPSEETPRIQECHILVGHTLCNAVEQCLFRSDSALTAAPKSETAVAAAAIEAQP